MSHKPQQAIQQEIIEQETFAQRELTTTMNNCVVDSPSLFCSNKE